MINKDIHLLTPLHRVHMSIFIGLKVICGRNILLIKILLFFLQFVHY